MEGRTHVCRTCGNDMIGDGYTTVRHCVNVDIDPSSGIEADAGPLYCCGRYRPEIHFDMCCGCVALSTEAKCKECIEGDWSDGSDSCRLPPEATLPGE
jgi:hypothetical protein